MPEPPVPALDCNCSICRMTGFLHIMVPHNEFELVTGRDALSAYQFGTGAVKGFAVTLIAGISASMLTSIFVVKTFYLLWLNRTRGAQTLSI